MSENELSDLAFARSLVEFFGARHAVVILGWCNLWQVLGVRSRADALASGYGHLATRYRILDDIRRFRKHLIEQGARWPGDEAVKADEDEAIGELIVHLGKLKAA